MNAVARPAGRGPVVSVGLVAGSIAIVGASVVLRKATLGTQVAALLLVFAAIAYRPYVRWRTVLASVIVVILFIPIRRYTIPVKLPFQLEPYRIMVALVLLGWLAALMLDPRVRGRKTGFERPIIVIAAAAFCSDVLNASFALSLESTVLKALTFLASFFFVLYLLVSVVKTQRDVDFVVKLLVLGGSLIGLLAIIEARTAYNVFDHLTRVLPFLTIHEAAPEIARGGRIRAMGPAEHPIALSAALALLIPLALYLAHTSRRRWWWVTPILLLLGTMATHSRTGMVMLMMIALVYVWLRPQQTRRMWPLTPLLLVTVHFAMPGTLGTLKDSFFPKGGLVAQQSTSAGSCSSGGRLTDLAPSFKEASQKPLLGEGYGTRIVEGPGTNACILDDQWLGTLLEDGAVAVIGWMWLFCSVVRRLGRAAKEDRSPRGWLLVGLAASMSGFAFGMVTYDAFSFVQVTFIMFILLGLSAVLLHQHERRRRPTLLYGDG